eukprot:scaffold78483_cov26-Prasinocladus_malaysianus.AAC.2
MEAAEVLTMAAVSKGWMALAKDEALWQFLVTRDWALTRDPTHPLPDKARTSLLEANSMVNFAGGELAGFVHEPLPQAPPQGSEVGACSSQNN